MRLIRYMTVLLAGTLLLACNSSTAPGGAPPPSGEGRCVGYNPLRNPYFGDLHVHTRYSLDANTQGTIVGPHEAYRFALGERLGIQPYDENGAPLRTTQLARPLDFAAVTDHAELFGETEICTNPDYLGYYAPECVLYRSFPEQSFIIFNLAAVGLPELPQFPVPPDVPLISDLPIVGANGSIPRLPYCGLGGQLCLDAAMTPWQDIQLAAAIYDDTSADCRFTTFIGYEWTGAPMANNLHRNVIFRSDVVPRIPPAYQEYPRPELLWQALDEQCAQVEGCDYLTIPHNSNLSGGLMFEPRDRFGNDYTREFAQARQANEPLAEIYQHKGQSECLGTIGAGANDELCGFELLPYRNFIGSQVSPAASGAPLERDFLRNALAQGLRLERELGANPFKYGFVASSDTHLGTPGLTAEVAYPGHGGAGGGARDEVPPGLPDLIENSPGGLAVLWAEENTREALFDAMRRREAYATSGQRPVVRFFGGWELPADLCGRGDFVETGYALGVPMGGDLPPATAARPRFAVSALRDPGAPGDPAEPLQRIQIVKGWVDDSGTHERVYEVAGDPANGAGVDLATCQTHGPGFASLCAVWEDPDFDPAQSAFWYARVIDNPSCRWATRQCVAAGIDCSDAEAVPEEWADCCDARYPKTVQERAWTSPIWYAPR
ncbi:DUF3604 domain-containing protein [Sinimarinibacterium thermocellulolyticum]|uniref:DUF3604 domain-containing protein n=1 Tax=Sinimarinibacterium thermocellulolyticum TaxID=3170016 RepID=A0ABV2AC30_9GAMM